MDTIKGAYDLQIFDSGDKISVETTLIVTEDFFGQK
jgi:hypothetical protein